MDVLLLGIFVTSTLQLKAALTTYVHARGLDIVQDRVSLDDHRYSIISSPVHYLTLLSFLVKA